MALYALLQSWSFLRLGCGRVVNYRPGSLVRVPQVATAFCKACEQSDLFPELEALHSVWLKTPIEMEVIAGSPCMPADSNNSRR